MCEQDPRDEKLNVRLAIDELQTEVNKAKGHTAGLNTIFSDRYKEVHVKILRARDKWLVTRTKEDGDLVIELCKEALAILAVANITKLDEDKPINLKVEHALMHLQMRINTLKHLEYEPHPLDLPEFRSAMNDLRLVIQTYDKMPNADTAMAVIAKVDEAGKYLPGFSPQGRVTIGGKEYAVTNTVHGMPH